MNFFGQMGAFFLALIFGQIVQATHRFDYPVYVVGIVLIAGCLLWLTIDAEKQLPEIVDVEKVF
jgi:ACS family glucarate transporter-like MFS transporter